jgi:hypothetical protein
LIRITFPFRRKPSRCSESRCNQAGIGSGAIRRDPAEPAGTLACDEARDESLCPVDPGIAVVAGEFIIEILGPSHGRESFCSGVDALDR